MDELGNIISDQFTRSFSQFGATWIFSFSTIFAGVGRRGGKKIQKHFLAISAKLEQILIIFIFDQILLGGDGGGG